MKKLLSFFVLGTIFLLTSCHKDVVNNPGGGEPVPSKKLVQTTVGGNISLEYNADGTLKKLTKVNPGSTSVITFVYSAGKVSYQALRNGKTEETADYMMVNGKAASVATTYYDAFENPYATRITTFSYNIKGLVDKITGFDGAYTTYLYDAKGNLTERISYNSQGQAMKKSDFEYGTQKDLFPRFGFFGFYGELFFTAPFAQYLPTKWKVTDLVTNQVTYEDKMEYILDQDGYMVKGKTIVITGSYNGWEWDNSFQ